MKMNREKIYSDFPKEYDFSNDSNNKFVLDVNLDEIELINKNILYMYDMFDIKKANGYFLDKIGTYLSIKREDNETDSTYRTRLLATAFSKLNDTTVKQLITVLKKLVENENDIFIFNEGITKTEEIYNDLKLNYKVFIGNYTSEFFSNQNLKEQHFKAKGGYIYICLNQSIKQEKRNVIIKILNNLKAVGIKIIFDFKYKIDVSNYAMGMGIMNTTHNQNIISYLFDNAVFSTNYETNANAVNLKANVKFSGNGLRKGD